MFKELLKAKRKYYGKTNCYPTAIKLTKRMWDELKMEGKALSLRAAHGFTQYSVNGMKVYIDEDVKDFTFGFEFENKFYLEPF